MVACFQPLCVGFYRACVGIVGGGCLAAAAAVACFSFFWRDDVFRVFLTEGAGGGDIFEFRGRDSVLQRHVLLLLLCSTTTATTIILLLLYCNVLYCLYYYCTVVVLLSCIFQKEVGKLNTTD